MRVIGRFADRPQLVLGHPGPRFAPQSLDREIGERRRDPHPVDLLARLHQPQAHVLAVEIHERAEMGLELPAIREAEGAHQADVPRAARLQVGDRLVDSAVLSPAHLGVAREFARKRPVVVPLDVHHLRLPRRDDRVGFDRGGPRGEPGDAGAGALLAAHEQMIDFRLLHDARQRRAAPRHLGVGETRILRRVDRGEPRVEIQRTGHCRSAGGFF